VPKIRLKQGSYRTELVMLRLQPGLGRLMLMLPRLIPLLLGLMPGILGLALGCYRLMLWKLSFKLVLLGLAYWVLQAVAM